MIKKFIDVCNNNINKDAFKFIKYNKVITKTFNDLLNDVYRFCHFFESKGLKRNDKVIVFILPSYELYTLMISGMMYGLNIVVIDDFKDRNKVKFMSESAKAKYVFVNRMTKIISKFIFDKLKLININGFKKYKSDVFEYLENKNDVCLTTFTSGTTSIPKIINRTFSDLENQVELLYNNFNIDCNDVNVCMLPIYVLFSLFNGNTTCIIKKLNNKSIKLLNGNIILGKINNVLKVKEKITGVKKVYLGGAYIYKDEAKKIINLFSEGVVNYIYGASEGVVIGINTLDDYLQNKRFSIVNGINVSIIDSVNGTGEIIISGKSVLCEEKYHKTGDIGLIDNKYIYIYGRKKYSSLDKMFYNYIEDEKVREKYKLDKAFCIWYKDNKIVFYEGKKRINGFIKVKKFPYDLKHKTKVDYNKLIDSYLD